jgi:hypothetical protein
MTCLLALLAIRHLVLRAFFPAVLTHLYAGLTYRGTQFALACHESGSKTAHLRAIDCKGYTTRHDFGVRLLQAGNGAMVASVGARVTRIDL